MATFVQNGDFVGPGEEETAKLLQGGLPENWTIISGVQLPTKNREDLDFIAIGENRIFVIEEKNWGPMIALDEHYWRVGAEQRRNPLYGTTHKAKVLHSYLSDSFPHAAVVKQRPVMELVTLSNPKLDLKGVEDPNGRVFRNSELVDALISLDGERKSDLHIIRDSIITKLSGSAGRTFEIKQIGHYLVTSPGIEFQNTTTFEAEHYITAKTALLTCFHRELGRGSTPEFNRELLSLKRLSEIQRTWPMSEPFEFELKNWLVSPSHIEPGADNLTTVSPTLESSVDKLDEAPQVLTENESFEIAGDAWEALSDIHAQHVTHRALAPSRIWLYKGRRVLFSHFHVARIASHSTLHYTAVEDDGIRDPYLAPEIKKDVHAASPQSDVFALGLILGQWLFGIPPETELPQIRTQLTSKGSLGALLLETLHESPTHRPSAANLAKQWAHHLAVSKNQNDAELLQERVSPKDSDREQSEDSVEVAASDFQVGKVINKFLLVNTLSEKAQSTTWLAKDTVEHDKPVILKQFRSAEKFNSVRNKLDIISTVQHQSVQSVLSVFNEPEYGFTVSQFFEGGTLSSQKTNSAVLTVDYLRKAISNAFRILHEAFHSRSVIHGDLSPTNLLIDEDVEVVFIDTELVTAFGEHTNGFTRAYCAPEAMGVSPVAAPESDIYALACTFIHHMLGRMPYVNRDTDQRIDNSVVPLSADEAAQWGPDGEAILKLLFKCVSVDTHKRPSDALEMSRKIARSRGLSPEQVPALGAQNLTNKYVDEVRRLYVDSSIGNSGMLALGSHFAHETYIPSRLDSELLPRILDEEFHLVILTGNPGDGKTSFLQRVGKALSADGGSFLEDNGGGWRILRKQTSFSAVFDASESFSNTSSDERIHAANIGSQGTTHHTALIAMNDGRLVDFVEMNSGSLPGLAEAYDSYSDGGSGEYDGVVIVNMKQRALTDGAGGGLGIQIAESLTQPEFWEDSNCTDCAAQGQCPIFRNVKLLRGTAQAGLSELTTISHLSGGRRATVRDFRSAVSWILTGDIGCEDVHAEIDGGDDPSSDPQYTLWNLAFEARGGDKLLTEWKMFDPSMGVMPRVMRKLKDRAPESAQFLADEDFVSELSRSAFWGEYPEQGTRTRDLNLYRHFGEVLDYLTKRKNGPELMDAFLTGFSRIVGAPGVAESDLAISEPSLSPDWTVIKVLPHSDFALENGGHMGTESFLEVLQDHIKLLHIPSGERLSLSLDAAELLLRANEGELFGDSYSEAIRQSLWSFANRIMGHARSEAMLVNPLGQINRVTLSGSQIALLEN